MRTAVRFVAVALIASLLAGALPPVAHGQQPAEQPALAQQPAQQPPPAQQPAQQPPPAQQQQQPGMMQEQMKRTDDNWDTAANIYNVAYVPGKVLLCGLGGITAFVLMLATFGTAYKGATGVIREGCGGTWVLTGDDVRPTPPEDFYSPRSSSEGQR